MSCLEFEDIYRRPELIILIYQQLSFHDQLRLAGVNRELQNIFRTYIHTADYAVLDIAKITPDQYWVCNKSDKNCMLLTTQEMNEFAKFYTDDVTEFSFSHELRMQIPVLCVKPLRNVTILKFYRMLVQDEQLKLIAMQCLHIKELHLLWCKSQENANEYLLIGQDLKIETLEQMENLKILSVTSDSHCQQYEFSVICKLLRRINLRTLNTIAYILPDANDASELECIAQEAPYQLRELKIGLYTEIWSNIFKHLAKTLENLTSLTIYLKGRIFSNLLENLAKICKRLETLTFIGRGSYFNDIQKFALPPCVKEFYLHNCYGITHENLRQILTEFRIEKFISTYNSFEGEFKDFTISPYVQVLDVSYISTHEFRLSYVHNIHLKELTWHEDKVRDGEYIDVGPLETCINLEMLNILNGYIPVEKILELKHLKHLKIYLDLKRLNWNYIVAVLKHSSLYELTIHTYLDLEQNTKLEQICEIPTKGFVTNVKVIDLNLHVLIFKRGLNFWLDLLGKNREMKLICHTYSRMDYEFLKCMVENVNFPKDIKKIIVWGISLKCKDLRRNFNAAISKLDPLMTAIDTYIRYFRRVGRLELSREN